MIGQKIKQAIEDSNFTPDQIAAYSEMSTANLYRIYKRDSIESRYLVKIAEILNLPYSYFLDEEENLTQSARGSNIQQANKVGQNHQSINVGNMKECQDQLAACQREKELLEQVVAEKERTITILMGNK